MFTKQQSYAHANALQEELWKQEMYFALIAAAEGRPLAEKLRAGLRDAAGAS